MNGTIRMACAVLAALTFALPAPAADGTLTFEEPAGSWGLAGPLKGFMAHAAACGDVDGDGDLDLYLGSFCDRPAEKYIGASGPVPNVLFINEGGRFEDSGQQALAVKARSSGAAFVDLDNDGDLDLYVAANSKRKGLRVPNKLFENDRGRFRDVSEGNGACIIMGGRSVGVLDFDGDGLLDLLVAADKWTGSETRLFRNKGRLAFEDATARAGLPETMPGLAVLTPDLNADGWPDLFVSQANRLFLSKGDGTYAEDETASKALQYEPLGAEDSPCGAAFGDLDGDGDMDLVIVDHNQPARQHLFVNGGVRGGSVAFRQVTKEAGLDYRFPSWTPERLHLKHAHVEIADFDNDTRPDIAIAATYREGESDQPFICRNVTAAGGPLRFDVPPLEKANAYFPAGPVADYDRDGRLDVLLASWFPQIPTKLLLNRSKAGRWLGVRVVGGTVNRMGIGAKVKVYAAGKIGRPEALLGYREIHISQGFCTGQEAVAHFGLGKAATCDVEVTLPFGRGVIRRTGAAVDRLLVVTEPSQASGKPGASTTPRH